MPTRAQRELGADPSVLKAIATHAARCLGAYGSVVTPGRLEVGAPVALERPIGDGDTEFGEMIPDHQVPPPDAHVHRTEMTQQLDRILGTLTPREQTVIRLRFGIGYDEPCTLEQVGQSLSVTREQIGRAHV